MRYSKTSTNPEKAASARGAYLRTSYKNTLNVAKNINGMNINKARTFLEKVEKREDIVILYKHHGSTGRNAQANKQGGKGRYLDKSCKFVMDLLNNLAANAEAKGLDLDKLVLQHVAVQQAPKQRRRTYRAHGRINKYESSPCHIELIAEEQDETVEKAVEKTPTRLTSRQRGRLAQQKRLTAA